uniref:Uncharacterized protein n=1 Tax=Panagrolaimus sp. PS1159 TaxID=55785 RepID=A0AC35FKE6_9BILA
MSIQLWRVAIPLGLYSITSAMFFPISQSFIYWKICLKSEFLSGISPENCTNRAISSSNQYLQTEANRIFLIGSIAMTITGIFSTTLLGKIGDEKSRKLAMIVPLIGLVLADFILLFLTWFIELLN